jgi:hypothetical protein
MIDLERKREEIEALKKKYNIESLKKILTISFETMTPLWQDTENNKYIIFNFYLMSTNIILHPKFN